MQILNQLKKNDFKGRLSFHFYGEPLLSKNLNQFVTYAHNILPNSSLHIYSNGTLLSLERFRILQRLGVAEFYITQQEEDLENDDYLFSKTYDALTINEKKSVTFITHKNLIKTNRAGLLSIGDTNVPLQRPCLIPLTNMCFTVQGNVLPCYEDYHQVEVMGNIMEKSLHDIWATEKYTSFRERIKSGDRKSSDLCKGCNSRIMLAI